MSLFIEFWGYFSVPLVFVTGLVACAYIGKIIHLRISVVAILYFWHTLFSMIYYWYAINFGADALDYYHVAKNSEFEFGFGTAGVNSITYLFVNFFGLSQVATFLVYNIFGAVGLIFLAHCLISASFDKKNYVRKLTWVILFLPSISFWSSAIGKDSLSFLAVSFSMWAALDLRKRIPAMAISISIMLLVRPHMAGMMVVALCLAVILENRASILKKSILTLLSFLVTAILLPFSLNYAGFTDGYNVEALEEYVDARQSHNMDGGGGIDISAMSLPEQLFAYMFRPFLFEVSSIFSLAAALDNLIIIFLFIIGGYSIFNGARSSLGESRVFMWTYSLMAWLVLAMTTSNMGIALRQKWMFAPFLIFLFISVMGQKKKKLL